MTKRKIFIFYNLYTLTISILLTLIISNFFYLEITTQITAIILFYVLSTIPILALLNNNEYYNNQNKL